MVAEAIVFDFLGRVCTVTKEGDSGLPTLPRQRDGGQ